VRPFSAALKNLPKSNASFLISAIERSVPSSIALSLSRRVSLFSLPSSIFYFKVSSSVLAISYFYSAVNLRTLSLCFNLFLAAAFPLSMS